MTRDEANGVVTHLQEDKWLMAALMYGAGLRWINLITVRRT
jgi:hypothetical protein